MLFKVKLQLFGSHEGIDFGPFSGVETLALE
jgi:hypothetical protein